MRTSYKEAPILKGRTNYQCLITNVRVDQAPCMVGFNCSEKKICPYFIDRKEAFTANYAVFNYQLFMNQLESSDAFEEPDVLFCDEAHLAQLELQKFITAEMKNATIKDEGWQRPKDLTVHGMATWAETYLPKVVVKEDNARRRVFAIIGDSKGNRVEGSSYDYKSAISTYNKYKRLRRTLSLFYKAGIDTENGRTWVFDKVGPSYQVRPVFVDQYSVALFGEIPKVVLMSATVGPEDVHSLGIEDDDYEYVEVGSSFDVDLRPIIYIPVAKVTRATEQEVMPMIVSQIDRIIGGYIAAGKKGIIHTVSYSRAKDIRALSQYSSLMLVHDKKDKNDVIREFKDSDEPVFLLSPSIMEGEDFPHDECRVIIIPKVPYLSLGDKVVRERIDADPLWYSWKAVQDIIQGSGRGMRSETDQCEVYILDRQFEDLLEKHEDEIPSWFRDAIRNI